VIGDVLDLVRDRPHVDLLQPRQRLEQRLSLDGETKEASRNLRLDLSGERRREAQWLECRVPGRVGAERVEPGGQVAMHADRLHESHRCSNRAEEAFVELGRRRLSLRWRLDGELRGGRRGSRASSRRGCRDGRGGAVVVLGRPCSNQPGEPRKRLENTVVGALEELTPGRLHGIRVLEVLLEEKSDVPGVQPARLPR